MTTTVTGQLSIATQTIPQHRLKIFLIAFVCLLPPLWILFFIKNHWVNLPFFDEMMIVELIKKSNQHALTWQYLWETHNNHRLVLTKLLYLLDYKLFAWNELPMLLLQVFIQGLTFLVAVHGCKKLYEQTTVTFWPMLPVFSLLLFAPQMGDIWLTSFLVQQTLTPLFFGATLLSVRFSATPWQTLITLCLAFMTTLASFNGLIIWPTLIVLLFLGKAHWRYGLFYTIIAALVIVYYAYGQNFQHKAIPGFFNQAYYFFVFLGSVFASNKMPLAAVFGFFGFFSYCLCCLWAIGSHSPITERREIFRLLAFAALAIGSAVLAVIGRSGADVGGLGQALQSRYICLSVFLWTSMIAVGFYLYQKQRSYNNRAVKWLGITMSLICCYFYVTTAKINSHAIALLFQEIELGQFAISQNAYIVNPDQPFGMLDIAPENYVKNMNFMKEQQLGIFHNFKPERILGSSIHDYPIAKKAVVGNFDAMGSLQNDNLQIEKYHVNKAIRMTGSVQHIKKLEKIYIVDQEGTIVGLGIPNRIQSSHHTREWFGFIVPKYLTRGRDNLTPYVKWRGENSLAPVDSSEIVVIKQE